MRRAGSSGFTLGTLGVEEMDEFSEKLRRGGVISDSKKFIADFLYSEWTFGMVIFDHKFWSKFFGKKSNEKF